MTKMWRLMFDRIAPVTVDRFTDKSVWINFRKCPRYIDWRSYHETWEEAHKCLLQQAQQEVDSIRNQLERANGNLGRIKGMKPPATFSE